MSTNIELFNQYTAKIFTELYESFPVPMWLVDVRLSGGKFIENERGFEEPDFETKIAGSTILWLVEAGFINASETDARSAYNATLSAKGLELMKLVPSSIDSKMSVGDNLLKILKEGSVDAAKVLISKALTDFFPIIYQTMSS